MTSRSCVRRSGAEPPAEVCVGDVVVGNGEFTIGFGLGSVGLVIDKCRIGDNRSLILTVMIDGERWCYPDGMLVRLDDTICDGHNT